MTTEAHKHQYGAVVVGILLSGLLAASAGLFNRITTIESKMMHSDYLEQRFEHIEFRVATLEKKCES